MLPLQPPEYVAIANVRRPAGAAIAGSRVRQPSGARRHGGRSAPLMHMIDDALITNASVDCCHHPPVAPGPGVHVSRR
eukprot:7390932-Prymnesium_polylepis.1